MTFDEAFDRLIGHEGGYANNPADPGGETMWGVTARVARARGYVGEMRDMPKEWAKSAVYRPDYWNAVKAEQLPDSVRFHVFDAAVNSGTKQAIQWLQRCVGVGDDGVIGPMTLAAVAKANPDRLAATYSGMRLDFMTSLPTWSAFGKGWARRIASNLQEA